MSLIERKIILGGKVNKAKMNKLSLNWKVVKNIFEG